MRARTNASERSYDGCRRLGVTICDKISESQVRVRVRVQVRVRARLGLGLGLWLPEAGMGLGGLSSLYMHTSAGKAQLTGLICRASRLGHAGTEQDEPTE